MNFWSGLHSLPFGRRSNTTLDRPLRVEKRLSRLAPRGQEQPFGVMPILMSVLVAMHQLRCHHHTHTECL